MVYSNCTSTLNTLNTQGGVSLIQLNYRDARPIYAQIVDGFRQKILTGVLENGDRLPSVRELATKLTINPNTIQRAYRELENLGYVASVGGKGCFVIGVPTPGRRQKDALMKTFAETAQALRALGVSQEELLATLEQGGKENA
mgnify:CR=1 FL=1